ncbi:MAG: anthranilate synthase component I [Kiritimatiellae bacterium]|nr:anthranilate synthase component I [Kiritimatiellia bacterium]
MIQPGLEEFKKYAVEGNLIPVFQELLADMETPVSVFSRVADNEYAFLLESVEGGERWGRYSFIGIDPYAVFSVENGKASLVRHGEKESCLPEEADAGASPLMVLRELLAKTHPVQVPGLPRFYGGAVGYLGYDIAGEFEHLPEPKGPEEWPDACLMLTDQMVIFDSVRHTMTAVVCVRPEQYETLEVAYADAQCRVKALTARLKKPCPMTYLPATGHPIRLESNMTRGEFMGMVEKAKRYIVDGDIIQAVLSQRFTTELPVQPLHVYRALRLVNPSPYTFFLKFGHRMLVGSSPEVMVRLTGREMELRPIAGTRRRGKTEQEDRALADELLADEKERAEHVMLVDLGRNDLGRLSRPGSVQVRDFMSIERYSHVMHIVSHVQSVLEDGYDAFDVIRATFPAGTLSGAPKIRAMEIIRELEPDRRGPYGGAVGYIGYDGNMDLCITIRTLQILGDRVSVQAGAGLVYDSNPEKEFEETQHKARAVVRALEVAVSGLDPASLRE